MNALLVACLISLALVSAQPAKPDKECFENRPKVRPSECCTGVSTLIDESAMAACKAKYPEPTPAEAETADKDAENKDGKRGHGRRGPRGNSCVIECYMNQTGIYKNGALDKATAVTVLGKSLDAPLKKTLTAAIDSCLAIQKSFEEKFKSGAGPKASGEKNGKSQKGPKSGEPKCNRSIGFLVRCVEMEMYKNCPADKKVASEDCTALTTYMDKCSFGKKH